jgi:hypothetical protein
MKTKSYRGLEFSYTETSPIHIEYKAHLDNFGILIKITEHINKNIFRVIASGKLLSVGFLQLNSDTFESAVDYILEDIILSMQQDVVRKQRIFDRVKRHIESSKKSEEKYES